MTSAIIVSVFLGLAIAGLPVVFTILSCRMKRRDIIRRTLEEFDREFPA